MAETTTEMNKELTTASIMSMLTNTSSTTGTTKLNTIKTPKVGLVLKSSTFESYITLWCLTIQRDFDYYCIKLT